MLCGQQRQSPNDWDQKDVAKDANATLHLDPLDLTVDNVGSQYRVGTEVPYDNKRLPACLYSDGYCQLRDTEDVQAVLSRAIQVQNVRC